MTDDSTKHDTTHNALRDDLEHLEDQYQEVARAMGCRTFFHADVLARAKELAKYWREG